MQRRMSKKRKILIRYLPEIKNLQKEGLSLRKIANAMYKLHNLKISHNYISELIKKP